MSTPIQRPVLPKLNIPPPPPPSSFIPSIQSHEEVWVPNPLTTKLASLFSVVSTPVSSASASVPSNSVYCSQCKNFYTNPAVFFNHIYDCN
ncbi:hypothetical protein GGI11_009226 [Coemansia sp. RSA 2049]|nr:hypothetical protein LPJ72_005441 [Coemansia sp. Benny D160-2]KAJ2490043.1 hypothetical protein GGI11_009226 [Coemansia sp. RSA 2049]KAJ2617165.1 hypothetical protein EV177_000697 [Coemansia sp. RSA 1804]